MPGGSPLAKERPALFWQGRHVPALPSILQALALHPAQRT